MTTAQSFAAPVVATAGSPDVAAPLVVLLHGRGSNEQQILAPADHLPAGLAYAAVRAPIAEGGGFAWFANRGVGRPVAASLRATMDWFRRWLDTAALQGRPVILVGFSGGAAFAGGLVLDDPSRYAGAAVLYGTLPFDAGVPVTPARLSGLPVFVAQGEHDTVIPRELLDRTWNYLLAESGAPALARRDPVGHSIATPALQNLAGWLQQRAAFTIRSPRPADGPHIWAGLPGGVLPARRGDRPQVSSSIPQQQESDNAPAELQEEQGAVDAWLVAVRDSSHGRAWCGAYPATVRHIGTGRCATEATPGRPWHRSGLRCPHGLGSGVTAGLVEGLLGFIGDSSSWVV